MTTVTKHGGLCNRIKNIWSALSNYDTVKTVVGVDSYIFPSLEKVDIPINPYPQSWRLEVLDEEQKYLDKYRTIDLLYEKTPKYFIDKYLASVEKLKINPELLKCVEDFTLGWDHNVVGLQIRTWHNERSKLHSNCIFEKEIDNIEKDKKIFLCTDNSDIITYFQEKYSGRIITRPQLLHDQSSSKWNDHMIFNDFNLVVDAFIDCYILSKCSTIIGTYGSTFSEVAWWFGKCKSRVIIPRPINFDENFNNLIFIRK